ncbi:MAG: DUF465 domain-containing protein [bacterium]|nr:DUF465 domain-containing protein [bacterium]
MPNLDDGLKKELLETDEEFRRLFEEHQNYKQRLNVIKEKSFLSPEDETEAKQIKLRKLGLKDRMEAIARMHRQERVPA